MIANIRHSGARRGAGIASAHARTNQLSRYTVIGLILITALLAFEIFNFDTTQYALTDLLGDVRFGGVKWASILAIAFCGIDFAGLLRVFTPDNSSETPTEVWYLMAAWLLGATMNAAMTWYAVSLALVQNNVGNEILSQTQLMQIVPLFVAFLVWLTRILFIGALTVAGNRAIERAIAQDVLAQQAVQPQHTQRATIRPKKRPTSPPPLIINEEEQELPAFVVRRQSDNRAAAT